jgi:diadenosine tetraphosphate (Ap4A) HIT family hydrolase
MATADACELCAQPGGEVVHRDADWRVVLVDDAQYPGFCRVIWNAHVKEMTDLPAADRASLMNAVWQVEAAVREVMRPDKINLATLGNMTPHLHWHVIPRYADDAHFPSPVWAQAGRVPQPSTLVARTALLPSLREAIARQFGRAA